MKWFFTGGWNLSTLLYYARLWIIVATYKNKRIMSADKGNMMSSADDTGNLLDDDNMNRTSNA